MDGWLVKVVQGEEASVSMYLWVGTRPTALSKTCMTLFLQQNSKEDVLKTIGNKNHLAS